MGAIKKLHGNAPIVCVKYNFDLFNDSATQDKVLSATDHEFQGLEMWCQVNNEVLSLHSWLRRTKLTDTFF